MDSAIVTYKGVDPSGLGGVTIFVRVEALGKSLFVNIQGSFELSYDREFGGDKARFNNFVFAEGMSRLHAEIETLGLDTFMAQSNPHRILLSTDNVPPLSPQHKKCEHQQRTPRALLCDVGDKTDSTKLRPAQLTTIPVCDSCSLPDDRRRCSELIGVWTVASLSQSGFARQAVGVCALGHDVYPNGLRNPPDQKTATDSDISRCRIGQRECARIAWSFDTPVPVAEDVGMRVLREIDYLNLVATQELGFEPIVLPDAEVVGLFMTEAADANDLTVRVAAAATLLEKMTWRKGETGGSLNAMESHLGQIGATLDRRHVRHLRAIVDLRHGPPVHDASDRAARGAATLGIAYPVTEHRRAWGAVRQALADAFHHVALAIKQRPPKQ